jgi:uncharacterized protein
MKILIDMGHPAHVHLFKHFIWEMERKGHVFRITARDKDVTKQLLDAYRIPYELVGKHSSGTLNLFIEWIGRGTSILKIAHEFQPDILMGGVNPAVVYAANILGKKAVIFTDSEPESLKYPIADFLCVPFADAILTLDSVRHSYGKKEIRVNSYKELAYLHPNWFRPDPGVLEEAGLTEGEKFVLLRFVAWGAYHDIGNGSFDTEAKRKLIRELEKYAKVFISSESKLPDEFEKYRFSLRPDRMHDFLYHAHLLVCDSQTMATEAAILGTPAIRCNSFVGEKDMGNFVELEEKYGLIFNYPDADAALAKAVELIQVANIKKQWQEKRDTVFNDKIDLTAFMIGCVDPETMRPREKEKPSGNSLQTGFI